MRFNKKKKEIQNSWSVSCFCDIRQNFILNITFFVLFNKAVINKIIINTIVINTCT